MKAPASARRTRAADHWFEIPARVIGERGVIRLREPADTDIIELAERLRSKRYDRPFVVDDGETRRLYFDLNFAQAEMDLADRDGLSFAYTRKMMAFLLFQPHPRHIALVGLGGGSLTKFCHRELPRTKTTTIEIDEQVLALSELFDIPASPRLKLVHADAAEYLATTSERYDVVILDGCDDAGVAPAFCTPRFYRRLRACLRPGAVIVVNQIGHGERAEALQRAISREFPGRHLVLDYKAGGNRIHFAFESADVQLDWKQMMERAETLRERHGLEFPNYARRLRRSWREQWVE